MLCVEGAFFGCSGGRLHSGWRHDWKIPCNLTVGAVSFHSRNVAALVKFRFDMPWKRNPIRLPGCAAHLHQNGRGGGIIRRIKSESAHRHPVLASWCKSLTRLLMEIDLKCWREKKKPMKGQLLGADKKKREATNCRGVTRTGGCLTHKISSSTSSSFFHRRYKKKRILLNFFWKRPAAGVQCALLAVPTGDRQTAAHLSHLRAVWLSGKKKRADPPPFFYLIDFLFF